MGESFYTDIDDVVIYCYVSTWMGTSIGAQHYYGKIKFKPHEGGFEEDLTIRLTQRAAIEHNKGLRRLGRPSREFVKAGEITENFMDKDTLRQTAIECFTAGQMRDRWDEKWIAFPKEAIFLIEGDTALGQPQEVIACREGFETQMERLNALFMDGDGWWWEKDSDTRLDDLSSRWYRIMQEVKDALIR